MSHAHAALAALPLSAPDDIRPVLQYAAEIEDVPHRKRLAHLLADGRGAVALYAVKAARGAPPLCDRKDAICVQLLDAVEAWAQDPGDATAAAVAAAVVEVDRELPWAHPAVSAALAAADAVTAESDGYALDAADAAEELAATPSYGRGVRR